jgi:hypothetical protein
MHIFVLTDPVETVYGLSIKVMKQNLTAAQLVFAIGIQGLAQQRRRVVCVI